MNNMRSADLIITGSLAFDTIRTRDESREHLLGGAAVYASVAAAKFCRPGIVSIAGRDFPDEYREYLTSQGVDIAGLATGEGETFSWSGSYEKDTNEAVTLDTRLNVFTEFDPVLPEEYRNVKSALLGNLDPELQLKVIRDNPSLSFTACDTMNFWIDGARDALKKVFGSVSVIFINEKEASMFTGERSLVPSGQRLLEYGAEAVIIKLGKYGAAGFGKDGEIFIIPCVPLDYDVADPTGAGDSFAGSFMGFLAVRKRVTFSDLKQAMLVGTVVAAHTISGFSTSRLEIPDKSQLMRETAEFCRCFAL